MEITIQVTAGAKTPEVTILENNQLRVKVNAPARDGLANTRLIEILAQEFKVSKSSIHILRGRKSKTKIIRIDP
jgi:uncharacterized protein